MLYASTYYGVSGLGDDSLAHHGIKGQKWGVRRYQNADGSFTDAGKKRYYRQQVIETRKAHGAIEKEHLHGSRELAKLRNENLKKLKAKKRNKEIGKEEYNEQKKYVKNEINRAYSELDYRAGMEHYKAIKKLRLDKAVLEKDLHGISSKRFTKAKRMLDKNIEEWDRYRIVKNPDGTFKVSVIYFHQ